MNIGDRVRILLHSRTHGYNDTGGGWSSDWVWGSIIKINRKTVVVRVDEYYYKYIHKVPFDRVRIK